MISVVPAPVAVTIPVNKFTVATDVLELIHIPPLVPLLVKAAVAPAQSGEAPLIIPPLTAGFTVIVNVFAVPVQVTLPEV